MFSQENESEEKFISRSLSNLIVAAEQNNSIAQYAVGVYLDKGENLEQNKESAYLLFKSAAENGMPQAMYIYGVMLFYGTGGAELNKSKGVELINRAALGASNEAREFLEFVKKNESDWV